MKEYEAKVMEHYSKVAQEEKSSSMSTMKNEYVRERETELLISSVGQYISSKNNDDITVLDVGCGNGYTLSVLAEKYPKIKLVGIEKNDDLRELALKRFQDDKRAEIIPGDIRNDLAKLNLNPDIIISQRVIINLLDREDQVLAINQLKKCVNPQGILIFIECYEKQMNILNEARREFGLKPIEPSFHNLYLSESVSGILGEDFEEVRYDNCPDNFLSSHYYISRVLHDVLLQGKDFVRNSWFVKYMTEICPANVGDFSPIKFNVFRKK